MLQNTEHTSIYNEFANAGERPHTNRDTKPKQPLAHKCVFQVILNALDSNFDFRAAAQLGNDENLTNKILVVLTVTEVLRVAQDLKLGLCRNADFIYVYNSASWEVVEREKLETFLGEAALKMGVGAIDSQYHRFREQLFKQFLAVSSLPAPEIINDVVTINLLNGTFEISNTVRQLREFRPADFLTYQLPFEFDRQAKCPKWNAFLNHVLPDKSAQMVLAEFIGYVFTRNLKLEKALVLFGFGSNGKSVVHDVVNALLGRESVSNYSLKDLSEEHYRAQIVNKLLNYSSEINSKIDPDMFKKLASTEPVGARLKYGNPFTAYNYAKLMFNANQMPSDVEHTLAYFRRFIVIPFETTISDAEKNPELAREIITSELSGVFNWVLEGLERILKQRKFSFCETSERMVEQFQTESDSAAMFANEECIKGGRTSLADLYFQYKFFC